MPKFKGYEHTVGVLHRDRTSFFSKLPKDVVGLVGNYIQNVETSVSISLLRRCIDDGFPGTSLFTHYQYSSEREGMAVIVTQMKDDPEFWEKNQSSKYKCDALVYPIDLAMPVNTKRLKEEAEVILKERDKYLQPRAAVPALIYVFVDSEDENMANQKCITMLAKLYQSMIAWAPQDEFCAIMEKLTQLEELYMALQNRASIVIRLAELDLFKEISPSSLDNLLLEKAKIFEDQIILERRIIALAKSDGLIRELNQFKAFIEKHDTENGSYSLLRDLQELIIQLTPRSKPFINALAQELHSVGAVTVDHSKWRETPQSSRSARQALLDKIHCLINPKLLAPPLSEDKPDEQRHYKTDDKPKESCCIM